MKDILIEQTKLKIILDDLIDWIERYKELPKRQHS